MSSEVDLQCRIAMLRKGGVRTFQVDDDPEWQSITVLVDDGYRHEGREVGRFPKFTIMVVDEKSLIERPQG